MMESEGIKVVKDALMAKKEATKRDRHQQLVTTAIATAT